MFQCYETQCKILKNISQPNEPVQKLSYNHGKIPPGLTWHTHFKMAQVRTRTTTPPTAETMYQIHVGQSSANQVDHSK